MMKALLRRLRALLRRSEMEAELDEELRFHLEKEIEQNVRGGMSPEEARRAALVEFGGVELIKEECRDVRGVRPLKDLWQDLRYAVRALLKRPGFTLVAVATLTLGVGATSAIFSVVNSVLLRPLPYKDSERVVQVWENNLKRGWTRDTISPLNFEDWRTQNRSFDAISAYEYDGLVLAGGESPERLVGILASSDFFRVLGVEPALGRGFLPGEDRPGAARVVVISSRLWQRRLGARADALGQPLTLNGEAYTVVGVMPQGFEFPSRGVDAWVPSLDLARPRSDHFMYSVARLKPSVTLETAQADVDAVARRLAEQYPDTNGNGGVTLVPLHEEVVGKARRGLLLMLGAVALLLLIACVNVANLLLARASGRQKEMAVRAALGASRWRIARQLLTESLLLGVLGGGCGALLSVWSVGLLVTASGGGIPRSQEVTVDARALVFTLAASVLTGLLFGLAPAHNFSAPDLNRMLKEGTKGVAGGRRQSRAQGALVVSEIALALVLLAGAGLLAKSYARLSSVNPGFDADGVLTARVSLSESRYKEKERQALFFRQVLERVRALPGVKHAGAVSDLPFSGSRTSQSFDIEGHQPAEGELTPTADYRKITPGYLGAMSISLLRGREFTERDDAGAPTVAVVNEAFARRFFPGEEALGKRLLYTEGGRQVPREIIGVVGDLTHESLADERAPEVYVPFAQRPNSWMFLAVRGGGETAALAGSIRAAVREVDAGEPVYGITTMRQRLDQSLAPRRFNAMLLGTFAAAATLLAAVGVFGVLSFQVAERRHEIGIRMALGAQRRDVLKLVVGRGLRLVLVGVLVGLAASLAVTRLMTSLLYGVSATDPATLASISLILVGVAVLASYLPARRATKVDPVTALRYE
jgi:predicted permease